LQKVQGIFQLISDVPSCSTINSYAPNVTLQQSLP
jgi:hypothetical protein